ncbi:MAG: histidine phosphatase family protein [Acidimicrobiia bacterium]|nr:histidine phosphatase family protein [Acidimicrobiia bacterium]
MARLLLIRHAPTEETGRSLTGRLTGHQLSDSGRQMAAAVAERLAGINLAALYSSPLERTWETAEVIAARQRPRSARVVTEHEGLLEVDYGAWSGRSLRSLYRLRAWRTVMTTPSRVRFPGGESLMEAQVRAVATCEELAGRHRGRLVGAVTHADIIKAVASHYLGQPLDLFNRLIIAPASVTVIDLPAEGSPRLVTINSNGDPTTWN